MRRSRHHRWSERRRRQHHTGRFRWTFGVLATAILLPILLASASPLLAALAPAALLTMVGVHALDSDADEEQTKALPAHVVSPHDGAEAHRIYAAIEIASKSRRV
jgi:hypothetical protein